MRLASIAALVTVVPALFTACATGVEQPPGSGGEGGQVSGPGGSGGTAGGPATSSSSGMTGPCTSAADCAGSADQCNTGACINGVCGKIPANELGACDDGINCTENDTCKDGVCTGGTTKFCPATDTCSVGSCDVMTDTCIQVAGNDGAPCNDDDACTLPGSCLAGSCTPGGMVDCSFLDGTCSQGYCDSQVGCKVMPKADGAPCDDNLYCTINDTCNAGQCSGVPNTCAAPGDVCLIGTCNEATDSCVAVPGNNGAACNDNSTCTTGETCSNGLCGGGAPANQGGACDDNDACTTNDKCGAGLCVGTPVVSCINGDGCCPANCNQANDDDCGGVIYMTSSNGTPGFYAYDILTNTWSILTNPPAVTYSQLTTDGKLVYLLGQNNNIYKYDPMPKTWSLVQTGPGPQASSPIGFFKWTPSGFYHLKDGDTQLYKSNGNAWQTFSLPVTGSSAGSYDPVTNKLYIRGYANLNVIIFSVATNTVTQTWPNPQSVGENSRTGSYYNGFFYERDWSAPFTKVDVATGVASVTNITPSEGHTATDVDPNKGDIYIGPYEPTGTKFQVYNVPANTLTTLAPAPVPLQNHSTIVYVK